MLFGKCLKKKVEIGGNNKCSDRLTMTTQSLLRGNLDL